MNLGDFRTCDGCVTIIQGRVPVGFDDLVKIDELSIRSEIAELLQCLNSFCQNRFKVDFLKWPPYI